jgi:hypothetical protein
MSVSTSILGGLRKVLTLFHRTLILRMYSASSLYECILLLASNVSIQLKGIVPCLPSAPSEVGYEQTTLYRHIVHE